VLCVMRFGVVMLLVCSFSVGCFFLVGMTLGRGTHTPEILGF
jgi:hypothetical protein